MTKEIVSSNDLHVTLMIETKVYCYGERQKKTFPFKEFCLICVRNV